MDVVDVVDAVDVFYVVVVVVFVVDVVNVVDVDVIKKVTIISLFIKLNSIMFSRLKSLKRYWEDTHKKRVFLVVGPLRVKGG